MLLAIVAFIGGFKVKPFLPFGLAILLGVPAVTTLVGIIRVLAAPIRAPLGESATLIGLDTAIAAAGASIIFGIGRGLRWLVDRYRDPGY